MTSDWTPGDLPGLWRRSIVSHPDERGTFAEVWRETWTTPFGGPMRQANLSRSSPGVLRGLHLHRRQADLWVVLEGHPFIALVDVRPALDGSGGPVVQTVDGAPGEAFYLPAGVAHGLYARDPIALLYLVTNEYDGNDELTFRWDDTQAAVPWPEQDPILSRRDASAASLAELIDHLRRS